MGDGVGARIDILIGDLRLGDAASHHVFDLARALLAEGYGVRILVNHRPGPVPDDLGGIISQPYLADYTPDADLTIVEYPIWYPLADKITAASGATLFWYHGVTDPALWPGQDTDLLVTSIARTNLAWHATLAVVTSPYTATELQRHADLPASRMRVVPLGVDLAAFGQPDAAAVARLRRTLGLTGRKVMLYVGRCVEHKRIDLMIETLAALASDQPDLALLIVGDTGRTVEIREHVAALLAQAETLGVADRVLFTGRVPSVAPYFALAELYLQASQHEGFGVPLVEAMTAGVPLVASASGAMPWLVGEGDTAAGLLFAPGDAIDLTAKVRRLLTEPGLASALAKQGARRAADFGLAAFNVRALDVVRTALAFDSARGDDEPIVTDPLFDAADIAFRDYRVRSDIPFVGPAIEWMRVNSTTHVKEAYFDRTLEQQVNYNRRLAQEVVRLRARVRDLAAQVAEAEAAAAQEAQ